MKSLAWLCTLCAACSSSGFGVANPDLQSADMQPDLASHPGGPPLVHRASPTTCPSVRAPTSCQINNPGQPCRVDGDCTAGKNGRCYVQGSLAGCMCSYDECYTDGDCAAGQVCGCRADGSTDPNRCLAANCRTDADCGPGGFCSPTFDQFCGPGRGVTGWYCHTSKDACNNASDCVQMGPGPPPYCAFHPETQSWVCSMGFCAG
jgi:hypothetical protein